MGAKTHQRANILTNSFLRQAEANMALQKAKRGKVGTKRKTKSKTRTKTATQTRKKTRVAVMPTGECSDSFFKYGKNNLAPGIRQALKSAPMNVINTNSGGQIVVPDGEQKANVLVNFLDDTELDALFTAASNAASTGKVVYMGGEMDFMITNHSSATLRFAIYVISQRRDVNESAVEKWSGGIDDTGGSATNYSDFGSRPFHSYEFNLWKKVLTVVPFCLAPGQTHVHHFKYARKRVYNTGTSGQTSLAYLKGWTLEFLVVAHGVAATDSTGASTTLADGQFNYIWAKRHKVKSLADKAPLMTYTNGLPTKGTITTRLYNTDTSAVANVDTTD